MPSVKIKDLSPDDRPREKMLHKGVKELSNSELLAILIGSGTRNKSALHLAQELLHTAGNDLNQLALFTVEEISKIKGIGMARAITIKAALELGNRRPASVIRESMNSPSRLFQALKGNFKDISEEKFFIVLLNKAYYILDILQHTSGTDAGTMVDVKWIVRKALLNRASVVALAHNHPSGNLRPSEQDTQITRRIKSALELFDIKLADHLIIHQEDFFSFSEAGLI